ncbi:methylenetetrahydrofolate reductase [Arenibacter sp. GZD96]|uniref:methylenetetrahydrofolate reductase n=1 Tax=Aurantibrevibacter litoralis TaxID=3106030 RepID=UPI002AFF2C87|nr:methylenetetrahydrofolate reductase [Arenibacter sp. GZD-96]MEA1786503.1 methylenetetrahydrofolate reductase [Arenibacter sp. GZD-96]
MLHSKIKNKETGLLFYGVTPPKENVDKQKMRTIADKQISRLEGIEIDGLVLYDIQDESSRTNAPRPFPFVPTLSPDYYSDTYLRDLNIPKIIYKSVGKYSSSGFKDWIHNANNKIACSVFVGSPSKIQDSRLSLNEAYKIRQDLDATLLMGGVTIPERHYKKGDEHIRLLNKIDNGCSFFISQCVYSINNTKDFLSDYYYLSAERNADLVPIIFTLTPCGSLKTLEFMKWLGIDIPKWLHNDLKNAKDILSDSINVCKSIATEIIDYSKTKNIPIGFNIESVAIRKDEIEASIELLKDLKGLMNK